MACKQSPCEKDLCDVYVELRKLIGNIDEFPLSPDKAGTVENHLKQLYDLTSMLLEQNDFQIVGSLDEMKEDGRLYVLRSTKSAYITINGSAFPISGSDSAVVESDPIYQADKPNIQSKTDSRLNNISNDNNVVNSILNVDKGVNDLNTYVKNINELLAQRLADLQDSDSTLQDNIDNEALVRGAADTLQLNKINANTSQISANANDIVTNKNNQTAINTQMTSEITTLDNKLTDFLNKSIDDDSDLQNQINQNLDSINQLNVKVDTNKSVSDAEDAHLESRINTLEARSQLMTIVKNQGETDEQALVRLITTPVTNQKVHVSDGNNHVSEWMWDGAKWVQTQEKVTNSVDLSQYSTTTESDAKYATKTETATLLSKTEASTTYATQTSVASKVDKNIADSTYQTKASMSGYYTKTETDTKFIDNVELQDLFNSYFEWIGAKTFTVAGRLPDVTTQPTTGVAADVNKVVAYEGEDWFLFEINKAGTITYVWQPVAAANTYSAGDTFDRDSIVEFFTSPDGVHNLKVLSGAKDVQDFTFLEGVQRDLHIAPNATGTVTVGKFNLNTINGELETIKTKNTQQDTAIAGKQDTLTSVQLTNIGDVQNKQPKTLTTPLTGYTATDVEGTLSELDSKKQNALTQAQLTNINSIGDKQNKAISLSGITATNVEGALVEINNKPTGTTLTQAQLANIDSIPFKQASAIVIPGITATTVNGALSELAGKGGGTTFKHIVESATDNTGSTTINIGSGIAGDQEYGTEAVGSQSYGNSAHGNQDYGTYAIGRQYYGNSAHGDQEYGPGAVGFQSYGRAAVGSQSYGEADWDALHQNKIIHFHFGKQLKTIYRQQDAQTHFATSTDGSNWTNTTHTADAMIKHLDAITGASPASPIDVENQIFEDLETESKTLVGAMNEILHMIKTLQNK